MLRIVLRFALIWALTMFVTPYVDRFLTQLANRTPKDSFFNDILVELSGQYSSSLIRSLGEAVGELVLGSKK
jgi:hypothetical protein